MVDIREEIDKLMPPDDGFDPDTAEVDGRVDLAKLLLNEFGEECYPFEHVLSPLWSCYDLWGFEDLMMMIATKKDLAELKTDIIQWNTGSLLAATG